MGRRLLLFASTTLFLACGSTTRPPALLPSRPISAVVVPPALTVINGRTFLVDPDLRCWWNADPVEGGAARHFTWKCAFYWQTQ